MTIDELNEYIKIAQEFDNQAIAANAISSRVGVNADTDAFKSFMDSMKK